MNYDRTNVWIVGRVTNDDVSELLGVKSLRISRVYVCTRVGLSEWGQGPEKESKTENKIPSFLLHITESPSTFD